MNANTIARRTFLAAAAAAAASALDPAASQAQQAVPNTTGTDPAKVRAPLNATDCHMHVYDPRFPESNPRPGQNPKNATVSDYRLLQKRTGTTRVVVVQPRNYATDNRVTVDALKQLGASARGVAVVHPTITDAELKSLAAAGIRGIRFSLGGANAVTTWDMVEPLSKLHQQSSAGMCSSMSRATTSSSTRICCSVCRRAWCSITSATRICRPAPTTPPTPSCAACLLDAGRTMDQAVRCVFQQQGRAARLSGKPPRWLRTSSRRRRSGWCGATTGRIRASRAAPCRTMPCCSTSSRSGPGNETTRRRILVDNPETLYGFAKSA